jgi:hypothetical protein
MKSRSVGVELFHVDGRTDGRTERDRQTDMLKLIVASRSFANTPENISTIVCFVRFPF